MRSSLRTGVSTFLAGFLLTMSQAGNAVTDCPDAAVHQPLASPRT
jgi:hypothetical protein